MTVDTQHALTVELVGAYLAAQLRGHAGPLADLRSAPPAGVLFEP